MIIKLFIKEVENSVGLLDHIQEVQVGIFGIRRWDRCVRHSKKFHSIDTYVILLKLVDVWHFKINSTG